MMFVEIEKRPVPSFKDDTGHKTGRLSSAGSGRMPETQFPDHHRNSNVRYRCE